MRLWANFEAAREIPFLPGGNKHGSVFMKGAGLAACTTAPLLRKAGLEVTAREARNQSNEQTFFLQVGHADGLVGEKVAQWIGTLLIHQDLDFVPMLFNAQFDTYLSNQGHYVSPGKQMVNR
jgi:hypothetical protein